jgi:hypothetical protein
MVPDTAAWRIPSPTKLDKGSDRTRYQSMVFNWRKAPKGRQTRRMMVRDRLHRRILRRHYRGRRLSGIQSCWVRRLRLRGWHISPILGRRILVV